MSDVQKFINNFRIIIASLPDREKCVCEIYYNHVEWAEISQENEEIMIQFYSHPSQNYWEFPIDIALEILQKAKKKFVGD
jgi:hypothetical protein